MTTTPVILAGIILALANNAAGNDRPIIGILAQDATEFKDAFPELNFTTYIAASYVKFVEEAGARAVPVFTLQDQNYYRRLFSQLNGLVLPGGKAVLGHSGYSSAAKAFWDLAHTNRDVYFPIWGTCLGHEQLAYLAAGEPTIAACDAENMRVTVELPGNVRERSKMFTNASDHVIQLFTLEENVMMMHSNCVRPDSFENTANELKVVGYSKDRQGYNYVSILEHKNLPIYGVQFHPEKAAYEWSTMKRVDQTPHTTSAIAAARYLIEFFVHEARKSNNKFEDVEEERNALIYNYVPVYSALRGQSFEQMYFF